MQSAPIRFTVLALVAAPFLTATHALAQGTSTPRTSGGLFGATRSGSSDTADRNRLNLLFSLTEALDSELPPELLAELPQGSLQAGGLSTMVLGSADYQHNRRRGRIAASAQTAFRYYDKVNRLDPVGHSGGLGAEIPLPGNSSFQIDQSAAYSPSYLYELFPSSTVPALGEAIPTAPDYRILQADSYVYHSALTFGIRPTRRMHVSVSGGYDRTEFQGELAQRSRRPTLDGYRGRAKVTHDLRRNLGLSVGYDYRTGDFGFGVSHEHGLPIGVDYSRALSSSRRAVFRFEVTPSTLEVPASDVNESPAGRLYRLQGSVSVDYPFSYNWIASGTVRRGVDYSALLTEPFLSDAARVSISGFLTRRLDVMATAGYASGSSAIIQLSRLDTRTGNVRLRFALSRSVALYSEYLFLSYDLRAGASLAPDLAPAIDRHGFRVGAMLWASAF